MKNLVLFLLVFVFVFSYSSCKKTTPEPDPVYNQIDLNISYKVDNDAMVMNVNKYINAAGNHYSINKLNYYISELHLLKANGGKVMVKDFQYIDALTSSTNQMIIKNVPVGEYIGMSFNIGLDSLHNLPDALPVTTENVNMIWPMMMGGGYHFMKMEGYFIDSIGASYGYAMHLGTNATLIPVTVLKNFTVTVDSKFPLNMVMNINEWYRNPANFDFNKDGNYIMGNAPAMKKFATNGFDVFSFQ